MTRCPRCSLSVAAFSRCERCGLMLGFHGFTVLLRSDSSPHFQKARRTAQLQSTFTEWREENGSHYVHVTYEFFEVDGFERMCSVAARLAHKQAFVTGMEVPWSQIAPVARQFAEVEIRRPERGEHRVSMHH